MQSLTATGGPIGSIGATGAIGIPGVSGPTVLIICINDIDKYKVGTILEAWDINNRYIIKEHPVKFYYKTDFKSIEQHRQDTLSKLGI